MSTETDKLLRELIDKRKNEPSASRMRMTELARVKGYISEMLEAEMSFVDIHSILEGAKIRVNIKTLKKFISEHFPVEFEKRARRKNKHAVTTPVEKPDMPTVQVGTNCEAESDLSRRDQRTQKDIGPDPLSDPVGFANKIFDTTRKPSQ